MEIGSNHLSIMSRLNRERNETIVLLHKLGKSYLFIAKALERSKPNIIKVWNRDRDKYSLPKVEEQNN